MRVVRDRAGLAEALEAAEREAVGAFGDGRLYRERYLERPRHVEVQLLADAHGKVVALGERDCSVQRRHQKVLEEAPAPGLAPGLRDALLEAAVAFGRAIGYRSAGTVEFVVEGADFYFLELNGRIQVEHPVTEAVTGLDLVAEQLRIAEESASRRASQPMDTPSKYASTPRIPRTFLPQTGRIERLVLPSDTCYKALGVRVDAGVEEGDEVGLAYDPMIAKLVAHGRDPRRGARPPRTRARRDRGRRRDDEPAVPALARRAPRRAGRRGDDGVPHRAPAALRLPRSWRRPRPGAGRGGSTCRRPPPRLRPTSTSTAHAAGRCTGRERRRRPDAGHGHPRRGRARRRDRRRAARSSCSRR